MLLLCMALPKQKIVLLLFLEYIHALLCTVSLLQARAMKQFKHTNTNHMVVLPKSLADSKTISLDGLAH